MKSFQQGFDSPSGPLTDPEPKMKTEIHPWRIKKEYIIKRFTNRECSRACFCCFFLPIRRSECQTTKSMCYSNLNCSIYPFFPFHVSLHCYPHSSSHHGEKMFWSARIKVVSSNVTFSSSLLLPLHMHLFVVTHCFIPLCFNHFLHPYSCHPIFHYIY